jgi:hypothetical protein
MTATTWTAEELTRIGEAEELTIQPQLSDSRQKYARYPTYIEPMVTARARATTLRLVPSEELG